MDGGTADFDDWEMLLPETEAVAAEEESVVSTEGLMMLRLDYFSIDNENKTMMKCLRFGDERSKLCSEEVGGGGSVESDNPSWIDPDLLPRRCDGEAWPDSASDRYKLSDCEEKLGLGLIENDHDLVFELEKLAYDAGESSIATEKIIVSAEKVESENKEFGNGIEVETRGEENAVEVAAEGGDVEKEVEQLVNVEKKVVLWWKLPVEMVKFCVFRISPVWSISVAAAMVGVFIIRRRMHMMKRKTKALQMKVTMDDKKVDQFMSRAARLNEAFSVVRRVPILRPSLPAPGVTPWPFVSMR